MDKNNKVKDVLVKSLFIVGVVIVVLILAYAIIRIVPRVFSAFANVGESVRTPFSREELQIEVEKDRVNSGELILISWNYEPEENGVYEIEYSCVDYLELELGTSEGNRPIECNTTYNLDPSSRTISLLPTLTRENILADIQFNIRYVNRDGNILDRDVADITVVRRSEDESTDSQSSIQTEVINPSQTTQTSNTNQNTQTTQQNQSTQNTTQTEQTTYVANQQPVGLPDLRIYDVFTSGDETVVFSVSNVGLSPTSAWYFNYVTPNGNVTSSPIQPALRPGDAIRYTLRLDNTRGGDVAIALDPRNNIQELSQINNIAVIEVRGDDNGRVNNPSSDYADLEIYDLEVGRMSGSSFIEDNVIYENDTAAIRFMVENVGGRDTGTWEFEVSNIPYDNETRFESNRQSTLRDGESREIIVEFERPDEGTHDLRVELDPRNDIREESTRNNDESETLRIRR